MAKKLCGQPATKPRKFEKGIASARASFIMNNDLKWINGTVINYYFMKGAEAQRKVVRQAFAQWKSLGIGISFKEVTTIEESMLRIGFDLKLGSWSYVGRYNLKIPMDESTMNFGWDLTANAYGMTTALHEIGHAIGFEHEHQSPFSGITWDKEAVYKEFAGDPNYWSKSEVNVNILNKLTPNRVSGSVWDPKSIMEYEFGPGLVLKPAAYKSGIFPPGLISTKDISGVKSFYPLTTTTKETKIAINKSINIKAKSGEQDNFLFTAPATRKFQFATSGSYDTVMIVSEKDGKENHYLSGDDDSGFNKNSKIELPLIKGRKYLVNIKVLYAPANKKGDLSVTPK